MTKKFNRRQSLEQSEVILEDVQEVEQEPKVEQEPVNVTLETQIPTEIARAEHTVLPPTREEIDFAKRFTGYPSKIDYNELYLVEACVRKGLLAQFGDDEFARGYKWHFFCK